MVRKCHLLIFMMQGFSILWIFSFFVFNRYALMPRGSAPGVSVGHNCIFIPSVDEGKGRVIIVGGANPSGSFSDSHIINLGK